MYILLGLLGMAVGLFVAWTGFEFRREVVMEPVSTDKTKSRLIAGGTIFVVPILFWLLMSFLGERLWFDALGYLDRFWTMVYAKLGLAALGATLCALLVHFLKPRGEKKLSYWPEILAGIYGAFHFGSCWQEWLLYVNGASVGAGDPIFGKDIGFYLFSLPFYSVLVLGLLFPLLFVVIISGIVVFNQMARLDIAQSRPASVSEADRERFGPLRGFRRLSRSIIALLIWLASWMILAIYRLMYSSTGVVEGPGWMDVHVRVPVYWLFIGLCVLVAVWLYFRVRTSSFASRVRGMESGEAFGFAAMRVGAFVAAYLIVVLMVPGLMQWLVVSPSELTYETPYIEHSISFTRQAFKLDQIEEREFEVSETLTPEVLDENQHLLSEIRLWDWRALDLLYKQFQEIRLYYEFADVDIDRYWIDGEYRQVMVSARELLQDSLPLQSQTFVNQRFKYTHGHGLTLAPVSGVNEEGHPELLVRDIPPVWESEDLRVDRPEIYYGELTTTDVVVNSSEQEFDYPSGDENVYASYSGNGGIPLINTWRKFILGWKVGGTKLLLSSYPTKESRVMFRRRIQNRVRALAPFLRLDDDPYVVIVDGRLYWLYDAYTVSDWWPYSESLSLYGETMNYMRNSVKVVIDAYHGNVDFYLFDLDDPVIQAWAEAFPGMFRSRDEMPDGLRAHVRYPADFLKVQGLVYTKYHMASPEVFYNQEDLWVRSNELYYESEQPVDPYYIMWERPGFDEAEFVLMMPFSPRGKQVMIGWIAGLSDGDDYGRFLAYKFPKTKTVYGTQQVEAKISSDRYLSGQITLWNQQGSRVIRGNLLVIPIGDTVLYVEPIYLRAEGAAYPELKYVAVMHRDNLSYAETFNAALGGLFQEGSPALPDDAIQQMLQPQLSEADEVPLTELEEIRRLLLEALQRLDNLERRNDGTQEQSKLHRP